MDSPECDEVVSLGVCDIGHLRYRKDVNIVVLICFYEQFCLIFLPVHKILNQRSRQEIKPLESYRLLRT